MGEHTKADLLRELHGRRPLVLPNVWDAASARTVAGAGFPALATSRGADPNALGHDDHEHAPVDEVLAATARIVRAVEVPVSADFESGFGLPPDEVVERLLDAGVAGCNLEDTDHATGEQRPVDQQAERLGAVVEAAAGRLVLNARVDSFLRGAGEDDAVARARAYLAAGADCAYPIGFLDEATTQRVVEAVGGTVNVLSFPDGPPLARLGELGVARVTFGTGLFRGMQEHLAARVQELRP
jgi:2-methylisocitrate lyase-like PEP mutase family enzyme